MERDKSPLTMGRKIVGFVQIDNETGKGNIELEPEFRDIILESLDDRLLEVSFYVKPGNPARMINRQNALRRYIEESNNVPD